MHALLRRKTWHMIFEGALAWKGFIGVWQLLSGIALSALSPEQLQGWFSYIFPATRHDWLVAALSRALEGFHGGAKTFAVLYLLGHGVLNLFLAIQLHRDRHWAYLVAIIAVSASVLYQIQRIVDHHSITLIILTIADVLFTWLTWHEYRDHRDKPKCQAD